MSGLVHPQYHVHPSIIHAQRIIDNLPEKTGRSIDEWTRLIQAQQNADRKARTAWLKDAHGVGRVTAMVILDHVEGLRDRVSSEGFLEAAPYYVDALYACKKMPLIPIHNALINLTSGMTGLRICPCKTMVPFYRNHVFAQIKPATLKRVELGLALKNYDQGLPERLVDTGGAAKGDRITHAFRLTEATQVDDEVRHWLKVAWDLDE